MAATQLKPYPGIAPRPFATADRGKSYCARRTGHISIFRACRLHTDCDGAALCLDTVGARSKRCTGCAYPAALAPVSS